MGALSPFARQRQAYAKAQTTVRAYYAALIYVASTLVFNTRAIMVARPDAGLIWAAAWARGVSFGAADALTAVLAFGGPLLAALRPQWRTARVLAFLGLAQRIALANSFGNLGHSVDCWMITSFVLIFLPGGGPAQTEAPRAARQRFLLVLWYCQAIFLLTYTMAGLAKVSVAAFQGLHGDISSFGLSAMAYHLSSHFFEANYLGPLGPWFIDHLWPGPFLMAAAVYLELFALWACFRPSLQRVWAASLIAFHIGTYLLLNIVFTENILLLAVLFLDSPFLPPRRDWKRIAADLPLVRFCLDMAARV